MLYTFRIQIDNISKPPVWRRVVVPSQFSFARFHLVMQAAFGWFNCHLYQFSRTEYDQNMIIGIPLEDDWPDTVDSKKVKLSEIFDTAQRFSYTYDFGDSWLHKIKLEDVTEGNARKARCLAGKGMCPPEDCGGPWGYEELKEIMKNPKHEEYESMKEWLGMEDDEVFDPVYFDLNSAQQAVQNV